MSTGGRIFNRYVTKSTLYWNKDKISGQTSKTKVHMPTLAAPKGAFVSAF